MIFIPIALAFISSLIVTAVITPSIILLMRKLKILDDPKLHIHPAIVHTRPVPRGGSIALFLGIFLPSIFLLPFDRTTFGIFIASFIALSAGVYDDWLNARSKDLSPYLRFLINIICATIVVASGVTIRFITNPLGGIISFENIYLSLGLLQISLGDILAGIWIIWVMNMLNWSKGVDGQMPGIVGISAIVIGILSLRTAGMTLPLDAELSFLIAGAAVGFLFFNFYPAKIFPGYGATAVYLLLAVVSILSSTKLATAILVMGVPIADGVFTVIRRLVSGKSPFWHDNQHLHHLLLRLGLNQRKVALFYWCFSAILGSISLALTSRNKLFAILMLGVIALGGLLFLHLFVRHSHEKVSS